MSLAGDLAAALDPAATFRTSVGSTPEKWQGGVLNSTAARLLLLCARQVGKSTTAAALAAHTAAYQPGSLTLVVSPSQRQSDETLAKIRHALGQVANVSTSGAEVRTESGSRVVSLPATEGTTRGYSAASLLLLDEAARIDSEVYVGCLPMVAPNGRVVALSTPGPRVGWYFDAWTHGDGWERHRVTVHDSAQYDRARIESLRKALSVREFGAEYECEFSSVRDAVFDPADVEAAFDNDATPLFGGVTA